MARGADSDGASWRDEREVRHPLPLPGKQIRVAGLDGRLHSAAAEQEEADWDVFQLTFETTSLPEGTTFFGGGSIARILRIEPGIRSVTLSAGYSVLLSVEVWGRQGIHDNGLADTAPSDGRPIIAWSSSGAGEFAESTSRAKPEWRDGQANDRQVEFIAPSDPGTYLITASVIDSANCLERQETETPEEHEARCSAQIRVRVLNRSTAPIIKPAPVSPPGTIPDALSDSEGVAYAVFTPVEGGSFLGDGYSLVAGAGAVANGEFIGVSVVPAGDASNLGQTWQHYTFAGLRYTISAIDSDAEAIADYGLGEPATACVPLPAELQTNIVDAVLMATRPSGDLTVLSSSVQIRPDGVAICGALSSLPTTVTAGKAGPPPEIESEEGSKAEIPPETGGNVPNQAIFALLFALGVTAFAVGWPRLPLTARRSRLAQRRWR